ncbi:hypothetical protein MPSEU_000260500 [Mayamaea pseudoterrestris]|nr:hypothetical protein MPSEU_000260500 [Mayamaea pseudoterrestris]
MTAAMIHNLVSEQPLVAGAAAAMILLAATLIIIKQRSLKIKTILPLDDFISVLLIDKKIISHDTRRFTFALPHESDLLGLAIGKHLSLQCIDHKTGAVVQRSYTPTSDDYQRGSFSLVVKVYPNLPPKFPNGGIMSQYLDSLEIGKDFVKMRGPKGHVEYLHGGKLKCKPLGQPVQQRRCSSVVMLAGGTGVTPMLQILHAIFTSPVHASKNQNMQVKLLYANQTPDDVLLKEELDDLARKFPNRFSIWYTVDRVGDDEKWKYSVGFINKVMIEEHCWFDKDNNSKHNKTQVFMCGPPPMIKFACIPALKELGCSENDWVIF